MTRIQPNLRQDNPKEDSERVPNIMLPQMVQQVRLLLSSYITVKLTILGHDPT